MRLLRFSAGQRCQLIILPCILYITSWFICFGMLVYKLPGQYVNRWSWNELYTLIMPSGREYLGAWHLRYTRTSKLFANTRWHTRVEILILTRLEDEINVDVVTLNHSWELDRVELKPHRPNNVGELLPNINWKQNPENPILSLSASVIGCVKQMEHKNGELN